MTTYAEVTGAVMITRNFNPVTMTWAAVFAIILAFFGKFNALLTSIPMPVMGGIMLLLFGSIAAIGLKTLVESKVDLGCHEYRHRRRDPDRGCRGAGDEDW